MWSIMKVKTLDKTSVFKIATNVMGTFVGSARLSRYNIT